MSKAFLQIAGVSSELEREMTIERVKSGMENAKAKGKIIGRPKTTANNLPDKFYKYYPQYKARSVAKKVASKILCKHSKVKQFKVALRARESLAHFRYHNTTAAV